MNQNSFDLFFSCISSLPQIAHVSRQLGKFSLPKSQNFQFHSHKSVLKILSKWKERRFFFGKRRKIYVAMMMMMDCLQEAFHHCMHVRLTTFECSCFLLLFSLMLIFDARKSWNEFLNCLKDEIFWSWNLLKIYFGLENCFKKLKKI